MRWARWIGWVCVIVAGCTRPAAESTKPETSAASSNVNRERPEGPMILSSLNNPTPPPANDPPAPSGRQPDAPQNADPGWVFRAWRQEQQRLIDVGLVALAERQWDKALEHFNQARALRGNDWLHALTERLRLHMAREIEAELVAADVQAVLDAGAPDEAGRLASEALRGFSHLRTADRLARLKRQANSLLMLDASTEQRQRHIDRWREEFEQAEAERNLRAAWLAVDELLAWTQAPEWQAKYEATTQQYRQYERLRHEAFMVWRNRERLDEAVALLEEAVAIWPNPEIMAALSEARLARRRIPDNVLAVADPLIMDGCVPEDVGARLADEVALRLHNRFEVMDRADFQRRLDSAKISDGSWHDEAQRRKLSEAIPELRYLVFSAVTPWAGLTLKAQMVDLKTGLVVQTGQTSAATWQDMLRQIEALAESMSWTENFLAPERSSGETVIETAGSGPLDDLPPLTTRLVQARGGREPLVPAKPREPAWGNLTPDEVVERLEGWPLAWSGAAESAPPAEQTEPPPELRRRAARVALELGDDYLCRGQFPAARRSYDVALTFWPDAQPIRERWGLSRALAPLSVEAADRRQRLIVLPFADATSTRSEAPPLGRRVASFVSGYLGSEWDIVDPSECVYWMGRLGLTFSDLLTDPPSRSCLAEALQAQYLLWGSVVRRNQIDIRAYLMDAVTGAFVGGSRIAGRDVTEIKNRLADLAWMLCLSPDERRRDEMSNGQWAWLRLEIEQSRDRDRDIDRVLQLAESGLKLRPYSVDMRLTWWNTKIVHDHSQMELRRLTDEERFERWGERIRQLQIAAARRSEETRREVELRKRPQAPLQAVAPGEGWHRAAKERQRQAELAAQAGRPLSAIALLESAAAFSPDEGTILRSWAQARADWESVWRRGIADNLEQRSLERQRQEQARWRERFALIDREREQSESAAASRRRWLAQQERRHADRWLNQARRHAEKQRYADAIRAAGLAQLFHPADVVDQLQRQWMRDWNARIAKQVTNSGSSLAPEDAPQFYSALDARLARLRQEWQALMKQGEDLLQQGRWSEAEAALRKAESIQPTVRGSNGWRQARRCLRGEAETAAAKARSEEESQQRARQFQQLLAEADKARSAGDDERAADLLEDACCLNPTKADGWFAWVQADDRRWRTRLAKYREERDRLDASAFRASLSSARSHARSGKWVAAATTIDVARRINPADAEAQALAAEIRAQLPEAEKSRYEQKSHVYGEAIRSGFRQLMARNFEEAIADFRQAQVQLPDDPAAAEFVEKAQQRRASAERGNAASAKPDIPRGTLLAIAASVDRMRQLLREGRLAEAREALDLPLRVDPSRPHPDVVAARDELEKAAQQAQAEQSQRRPQEQRWNELMAALAGALQSRHWSEVDRIAREAGKLAADDPVLRVLDLQKSLMRGEGPPEEKPEK